MGGCVRWHRLCSRSRVVLDLQAALRQRCAPKTVNAGCVRGWASKTLRKTLRNALSAVGRGVVDDAVYVPLPGVGVDVRRSGGPVGRGAP